MSTVVSKIPSIRDAKYHQILR